jgi:hypothetical protein
MPGGEILLQTFESPPSSWTVTRDPDHPGFSVLCPHDPPFIAFIPDALRGPADRWDDHRREIMAKHRDECGK